MSELVLASSDPRILASHMGMIGLASIAQAAFPEDGLTVRWSAGMAPRPLLSVTRSPEEIAEAIRSHAMAATTPGSWVSADHPDSNGNPRALMSPRRSRAADDDARRALAARRREVIDNLLEKAACLDLRMLGGLGEPSHWHRNTKDEHQPDHGASRFDMQARNQGAELVSTKLRPLARHLAARTTQQILDGLTGAATRDDLNGQATEGLTATGMAPSGPFDSALAWCALWGISGLPVAPRVNQRSATSAAAGTGASERFHMPLIDAPISVARLRSLLGDGRLLLALSEDPADRRYARGWLAGRNVRAVVAFTVTVGGSANAPTRAANLGVIHPTVG